MLSLKDITNKINKAKHNICFENLSEAIWPFMAENLKKDTILFVSTNSQITSLAKQIKLINNDLNILEFPNWDCQVYDMSNPNLEIQAHRVRTIKALVDKPAKSKTTNVIITTVGAFITKTIDSTCLIEPITIKKDTIYNRDQLIAQLIEHGFKRVNNVYQELEFSVRGDILDIFPNGDYFGYRIEFFDDDIESIHKLDIKTQRRTDSLNQIQINQLSELILNKQTQETFSKNYLSVFKNGSLDKIYQNIKLGKLSNNSMHFLPLFYSSELKSLKDYLPADISICYADSLEPIIKDFNDEIISGFKNRQNFIQLSEDDFEDNDNENYRPINPQTLYLSEDSFNEFLESNNQFIFNDLISTDQEHEVQTSVQTHIQYSKKSVNKLPLNQVADDIKKWIDDKYKVYISCFNDVSTKHIKNALHEYNLDNIISVDSYKQLAKVEQGFIGLVNTPIEFGYLDTKDKIVFLTEQDIFGTKQKIKKHSKSSNKQIIEHLNQLKIEDTVVHFKHGIGQFIGLETIKTSQAENQDFAVIKYANDNKLFIPIINLDSLSLYSHAETGAVTLDKLGNNGFLAKKEKVKKKLLEIADQLIKTASARSLLEGFSFNKVDGMYDEFAEGFEYMLTQDQESTTNDVIEDMYSSRPMDRLVIGDVGFGKTEIALRACFVCVSNIKQAAIIVPTTLLARQHFKNFTQRFERFGFKVAMLSRLNTTKQNKLIKEQMASGEIDIVIGTHALLAKDVKFDNLGLLVIDEEQRFGVSHKEKLKALRNSIDILTLSATPIPRTLQMSVSGIRELSLITTPPIDRLPIKTSIIKYDSATLKQAINRELHRNGQIYIITPRVEGIHEIADKITKLNPTAKIKVAHGQMPRVELEDTMQDFSDGKFDILIATTIIESGIDIAKANTMIVFDAHKFGLAQLYQIRGRIGRSKVQSFAYFLTPNRVDITNEAKVRLKILKKLDNIGAGFTLASYDMDLRGPGNILGSEQSGHIREVGFSLYNNMLKDAIKQLKAGNGANLEQIIEDSDFTPTINMRWSFLLPESYIQDSNMRLSIYRRLSKLTDIEQIDDMLNELNDRFGKAPKQVESLLEIINFKAQAKALNIESLDIGTKGIVFKFKDNYFKNSEKLLPELLQRPLEFKLRPDQKIVYHCVNGKQLQATSNINKLLAFVSKFN